MCKSNTIAGPLGGLGQVLQKLYGPLDVAYSDELDAKERAHSLDAPKNVCPMLVL